ncbi:MAG: RNA polymerase sigma factor [Solirubrobacteraceae bacterium]
MEVSALKYSGGIGLHGPVTLFRLQSDERLVTFTRRGNRAAFEALVNRYESRLLAFCRHLLGSREDAEDVLQEVLAAAFNAMLADDRPINVRPWLYRIARNRSLNHLRRIQAIGVDSMDVHFSDNGASTADKVHDREEFRLLVGDIHELPETQKTALVLREMDALSYEQIAEAMETTVPSVKSLLVRARISLAEASEARLLSCEEVRTELGEIAEGLRRRPTPLVRRHLGSCKRCCAFRVQLKQTNRALAVLLPVGPLLVLKKVVLVHLWHSAGSSATAGSGAAGSGAISAGAAGSGAISAGVGPVGSGAISAGVGSGAISAGVGAVGSAAGAGSIAAVGSAAAAGSGIVAGSGVAAGTSAGGFVSAGIGAVATKAAAGLAAAALVTAGAVDGDHSARRHGPTRPTRSLQAQKRARPQMSGRSQRVRRGNAKTVLSATTKTTPPAGTATQAGAIGADKATSVPADGTTVAGTKAARAAARAGNATRTGKAIGMRTKADRAAREATAALPVIVAGRRHRALVKLHAGKRVVSGGHTEVQVDPPFLPPLPGTGTGSTTATGTRTTTGARNGTTTRATGVWNPI